MKVLSQQGRLNVAPKVPDGVVWDNPLREVIMELMRLSKPGPGLWNPYAQEHPDYDLKGGSTIRIRNLATYAHALDVPLDALVVGEAPGSRGARFSGIAFTSEHQLVAGEVPVAGQQSSAFPKPRKEVSGLHMWRATRHVFPKIGLWNSLPFHPFKEGDFMSMRAPTDKEQKLYAYILDDVVAALKPEMIVAVGRRAEAALTRLGHKHVAVRHPSMGGSQRFAAEMKKLFGKAPDVKETEK